MSKTAPNHYVQQYRRTALREYAATGFTMVKTVMPPEKIDGEKLHFMKFGKVKAQKNVQRGDEAIVANPNDTKIVLEAQKDKVYTHIYEDDLDQMTVNRKQEEAMRGAEALGRSSDEKIVKKLKTGSQEAGSFANLMNVGTLLKAKQIIMSQSALRRPGELFVALNSVSWTMLLADKRIASADYVGPHLPYLDGAQAKSWNGMHLYQLDDETLLGDDFENVNDATDLMYLRPAVGFGYTRKLTLDVEWENKFDRWEHNMRIKNGAEKLHDKGIVQMKCKYDPDAIETTITAQH